jgi:cysteine desulfuration protein SufE
MSEIDAAVSEIADEFAFFDGWEERYEHMLSLGRGLAPLADAERTELTKVRGCASQVWLVSAPDPRDARCLVFRGDSDSHLVRGVIALLLRIFSGRTAADIAAADPVAIFARLGLKDALTPQRSNGAFAMMQRIQREAAARLEQR